MRNKSYHKILDHYEKCFDCHGVSHKGMDWPNENDLHNRFEVMLGIIKPDVTKPVSLLDLGCGVGLLADYILSKKQKDLLIYKGVDLSYKMIREAVKLHPDYEFESRDILGEPLQDQSFDYVVMNGLLTEKLSLDHETMEGFAREIIKAAFSACRIGIAFNVMSSHVDWERDDLFHWPLDSMTSFLVKNCSRSIVVRMDYGLYEYTVYVYREPNL